jgi:hypothetical protein
MPRGSRSSASEDDGDKPRKTSLFGFKDVFGKKKSVFEVANQFAGGADAKHSAHSQSLLQLRPKNDEVERRYAAMLDSLAMPSKKSAEMIRNESIQSKWAMLVAYQNLQRIKDEPAAEGGTGTPAQQQNHEHQNQQPRSPKEWVERLMERRLVDAGSVVAAMDLRDYRSLCTVIRTEHKAWLCDFMALVLCAVRPPPAPLAPPAPCELRCARCDRCPGPARRLPARHSTRLAPARCLAPADGLDCGSAPTAPHPGCES